MKALAGTRRGTAAGVLATLAALPVVVASSPLWAPLVVAADLLTRRFRLPTLRIGIFTVVYLTFEWIAMARAAQLTLTGRRGDRPAHDRMQCWWIGNLLDAADRILGISIEWPEIDLPENQFIIVSRHASAADAVIPAYWMTNHLKRPVHYLLKAELGLDPALGIYGRRLGNHFVRRGDSRQRELEAITDLGHQALPRSATVIFPEGTYATDETRERIRSSLAAKGPSEALGLALELDVLLPPKPAGLLALLDAMPEADVVFIAHIGLEGVAEVSGIRKRTPLPHPVQLQTWTIRRADLPAGEEERIVWLNDQWRHMEHWVVEQHRLRRERA